MSKESPTAYLSPSNRAEVCPHKDMNDTWLDDYVTSRGENLQGKTVETTMAVCTHCDSLVLIKAEPRFEKKAGVI